MPTVPPLPGLQPWEILQRHTMEEDWVYDILTPLLKGGVSVTREDSADCLEVARLFSETQIVGRPITGHECYDCIQDGGCCMVPARELLIGDTEGIYAIGRCTNCVLSGAACNLPQRTAYTECFCDWFMPNDDREEYLKWRRYWRHWTLDIGRPIKGRELKQADWAMINAYNLTKTKLRVYTCLPLPSTRIDNYPDVASWTATMERFVQAAMPELWGRPLDFKPVPCGCVNRPLKGAPQVWTELQLALRQREGVQAVQPILVAQSGTHTTGPATPGALPSSVEGQPEPASDGGDDGRDELITPKRRRARGSGFTYRGRSRSSPRLDGPPRPLRQTQATLFGSKTSKGQIATHPIWYALGGKSEGTEALGEGEEEPQLPNPEHCPTQ